MTWCVWWMVYGWMAWSGLFVLVVTCVYKFSLPGGGFILFLFVLFFYCFVCCLTNVHRELIHRSLNCFYSLSKKGQYYSRDTPESRTSARGEYCGDIPSKALVFYSAEQTANCWLWRWPVRWRFYMSVRAGIREWSFKKVPSTPSKWTATPSTLVKHTGCLWPNRLFVAFVSSFQTDYFGD